MTQWHGGKGSKVRKAGIDQAKVDANWDAIFGDKNQKHKQQDMTELNADGNRDRGREGEDLTWEHYCTAEASLMGVGKGEECNWCGETE
jgi:hypothetical protein